MSGGGARSAALVGGCALLPLLVACVSQSKAPVVDRSAPRDAASASQHGAGAAGARGTYLVRPKDTLYSIAYRHELDYRALAAANGIQAPFVIQPGQRIQLAEAPYSPAPERPPEPLGSQATPVQIVPSGLAVETTSASLPARAAPDVPAPPEAPPPAPASPPQTAEQALEIPTPPPKPPAAKPPAPAPAHPVKPPVPTAAGWQKPVAAKPVRRFGGGSKGFDYDLPAATRIRAATSGVVVYSGPGIGGFRHLVIVKASEQHLVAYGVNVAPLLREGDEVRAGAPVAEIRESGKTAGRFHFEVRAGGKPVDPAPLIGA